MQPASAPSVNIAAFENGVGNSRDIRLLADALRRIGCQVEITRVTAQARRRRRIGLVRAFWRWRRKRQLERIAGSVAPQFDVTVMMEHVWPEQLLRARHNVIVPNPEFFDRHDRSLLDVFDVVWAKTGATRAIFAALGAPCQLVGFDSEDRLDAHVPRERAFFHLAGKSRMKGTSRLLAVWAKHPEWPVLTVVRNDPTGIVPPAHNIRCLAGYLDDGELRRLQNCHRFHVCTSETEGWGHYLVEAESVGAVIVATDAPPMNELVTAERGVLVRARPTGTQHLAGLWAFDEADFERAVDALLRTDAPLDRLGHAARAWFESNRGGFDSRLRAALEALMPALRADRLADPRDVRPTRGIE